MSKYVKYISSSHYGAPPLKGDRYGYFVELLRSCLCTGFNANDSIISIETIDELKKYWTEQRPKAKNKSEFDARINARKEVLSATKK